MITCNQKDIPLAEQPGLEIPQELEGFAAAASRFIRMIETAHQYELLERFMRCAAVVADLYGAGLYLPLQDAPLEPEEPPFTPEVAYWEGFEELTMFWQVPDAYAWEAPKVISLTDLLLDTHRDVKRGLLWFEEGQEARDMVRIYLAAWYWRSRMEERWGTALADALRALQRGIHKIADGQRD
jgi:Domain of unknown function (DUF5063)